MRRHRGTTLGLLALRVVVGCAPILPLGSCKPASPPPPAPAPTGGAPEAASTTTTPSPAATTSFASGASLSAHPAALNLGVVVPGGAWAGSFQLTNSSDKAISIAEIKTDCSCTTVQPHRNRVLHPGESLDVAVNYRAKLAPATKTQHIWVTSNDAGGPPLDIPVHVEIAMQVRATPSTFRAFKDVNDVEAPPPFGTVVVESADGAPFQVLSTAGGPPAFADGYKPGDPLKSSYRLQWDLRPFITPDCVGTTMPWWWVIETDHPLCPVLDIRVMHDCTRNTTNPLFPPPVQGQRRLPDLRANAGAVTPDGTGEFLMSVGKQRGFDLVKVESLTPQLLIEPAITGMIDDGTERFYTCAFKPAPGHRGLLIGIVRFTASDGWTAPMFVIAVVRD